MSQPRTLKGWQVLHSDLLPGSGRAGHKHLPWTDMVATSSVLLLEGILLVFEVLQGFKNPQAVLAAHHVDSVQDLLEDDSHLP